MCAEFTSSGLPRLLLGTRNPRNDNSKAPSFSNSHSQFGIGPGQSYAPLLDCWMISRDKARTPLPRTIWQSENFDPLCRSDRVAKMHRGAIRYSWHDIGADRDYDGVGC